MKFISDTKNNLILKKGGKEESKTKKTEDLQGKSSAGLTLEMFAAFSAC
jgi:hypothetical protein